MCPSQLWEVSSQTHLTISKTLLTSPSGRMSHSGVSLDDVCSDLNKHGFTHDIGNLHFFKVFNRVWDIGDNYLNMEYAPPPQTIIGYGIWPPNDVRNQIWPHEICGILNLQYLEGGWKYDSGGWHEFLKCIFGESRFFGKPLPPLNLIMTGP